MREKKIALPAYCRKAFRVFICTKGYHICTKGYQLSKFIITITKARNTMYHNAKRASRTKGYQKRTKVYHNYFLVQNFNPCRAPFLVLISFDEPLSLPVFKHKQGKGFTVFLTASRLFGIAYHFMQLFPCDKSIVRAA